MESDTVISIIKSIFVTLAGWFMSSLLYFLPIRDMMYAILLVFLANFLCGYLAGMIVQHEKFNIKKSLWALAEVAFYIIFLILLFILGRLVNQEGWLMESVRVATYAWIGFYSINILKNLKRGFPNSKPISFLYYMLSLEFLKALPYVKRFEEQQKKEEETKNESV